MSRNGYDSLNTRKRTTRRNGPDFGKMNRKQGGSRLPGFFVVLALSVLLGVVAYKIADKKMNLKPSATTSGEISPSPQPTLSAEITRPLQPTPSLTDGLTEKYPDGVLEGFVDTRERVNVKGIYVNTAFLGRKAGSTTYPTIDELIELCDTTEINAMVIDIKDDTGYILYDTGNQMINEIKGRSPYIHDLKSFVQKLKDHNIYCIARIVTFKDSVTTKARPNMAIKTQSGEIFVDGDGERWLNPYNQEVRNYLISIAKEAAEAGFDEIQFDYLRMSSSDKLANADFGDIPEGMTKMDAVTQFVQYACEELKPLGVFVSGDVFATIINSVADGERIGQSYVNLSRYLDYICPMTYPSHYNFGYGGLKYPDTKPFQLLLIEMRASQKKLSVIGEGEHKAGVRPWLQDFTANWLGSGKYLEYGPKELRAQISAVYSAGYSEWILWNAVMQYSKEGLLRDKDY